MKKQFIFASLFSFAALSAFAQTNTFPTSGFAGIGTLSPATDLQIDHYANQSTPSGFFPGLQINGYMSVPGTMNSYPYNHKLFEVKSYNTHSHSILTDKSIFSVSHIQDNRGRVAINKPQAMHTLDVGGNINTDADLYVHGIAAIGNNVFTNMPAGYSLYVQDGILTTKVKVAVLGGSHWSDFVFADDYELKDLSEVESFIKKNKHLPEIPSATEMVEKGLDVATMDAKLLQKIEELTLYVIQQQKEINELKKKIKN